MHPVFKSSIVVVSFDKSQHVSMLLNKHLESLYLIRRVWSSHGSYSNTRGGKVIYSACNFIIA